ncbi:MULTISPECIES: DUF1302 domain-containing protein [unclassified Pseudomonas]|uniref:DUF1302 domain-containing protein n=1 Tax=unclassified Pseudomonas TaxID=196821 RepID=UPI000730CED5|nr:MULTISPECIES: DUF1302 domain-containing protein [unclassified Pseudomonas]KSW25815.1 glycine/betaine transmethylase [Pseudomonas sp. ADP]OBP12332.1 glycine/betaine transmethylase [Pseudomonas sp. EGD-AKN5]QOF82416.1 DUF1302 domain-containing protein [Pseudomonas sp. ADPe]GLU42122.1 glycine/betaine transmethylase [Pseudomonas sp. NBRC 100443]
MTVPSCKPSLSLAIRQALGLVGLAVALPAGAVEFSFLDNELSGNLDTTLSYGRIWRVQSQDKRYDAADINLNDGNRNFDTGLVSEVYKITSDFEARYQNYGAFARGSAFYDTQIMDKRNDYYHNDALPQPSQNYPQDDHFTSATRDNAGRGAELLDAYLFGNWDFYGHSLNARVGRQVFNWGESLFYRGGVNTTNPVDATKLHLPGSEIKEVLIPLEALQFSVDLTQNLSLESFYQWNWRETQVDPVGTFFSETDLFADGGNSAYLQNPGFAAVLSPLAVLGGRSAYQAALANPAFGLAGSSYAQGDTIKVANIGKDLNARDSGQFGAALHYIAEQLNSTEFGLYFVNYHSKEPLTAVSFAPGYQGADMAALRGSPLAAGANLIGSIDMAGNAVASREYVENIQMYGLSFNSTVGQASVFGELAYRPNLPISIAATNDIVGDLLGQSLSGEATVYDRNTPADQACALVAGKQLCRGSTFHNYERVEAFNSSLGTLYNFGQGLSFDSLLGTAEIAAEQIRGSSLKYTAYNGQVRYYAGRPNNAYGAGFGDGDQADRNAYGFTLQMIGTWNDAFAGVNVSPYAVFKDDFKGNSYQNGNFIEGRKAYTLGVKTSYRSKFDTELQFTKYYGASRDNTLRDRDNVGFNVKYSF